MKRLQIRLIICDTALPFSAYNESVDCSQRNTTGHRARRIAHSKKNWELETDNSFVAPHLNPLPKGERRVWDFAHWNLPFDLAQDGELAEPLVICDLRFVICFASLR